jgi:hypothetical protein
LRRTSQWRWFAEDGSSKAAVNLMDKMPTHRETILTTLADLLRTVPHVPVLRGEVLPERIPPSGLMILRDGNPGEPGVTLSPLMYLYWTGPVAVWWRSFGLLIAPSV